MTGWANINDYQETGYNDYVKNIFILDSTVQLTF